MAKDTLILGPGNKVGIGSSPVLISGVNNRVGDRCSNISLIGCTNIVVGDGVENVVVVNTNNQVFNTGNISVVNGIHYDDYGNVILNNVSFVEAGLDIVYDPYQYPSVNGIQMLDGGLDLAKNIYNLIINIDFMDGGIDNIPS